MTNEESRDCLLAENGQAEVRLGRAEFICLITEYDHLLYNVSRSMLRCDADCRDAIQETVLAAWRSLDHLKNPACFKTWLVRILINQCNGQLRKRRYSVEAIKDLRADCLNDEVLAVRGAVESLPKKLLPVVVLYYYEDFSTEEIARSLAIPQGTVKSRLAMARSNLKRKLE